MKHQIVQVAQFRLDHLQRKAFNLLRALPKTQQLLLKRKIFKALHSLSKIVHQTSQTFFFFARRL